MVFSSAKMEHPATSASRSEHAAPVAGCSGDNTMRVLIIDDNRDISYLVSSLVERFGHQTKVVTVPQAALDIAQDWKPEFVFIDLAMPGMDGYSVARLLRDRGGLDGAKIIALSGYAQNTDKEDAAGIDGHVLKPISAVKIKQLLGDAR
jgi:CheY-like chemotaxis protein